MKIALIGATGNAGSRILAELSRRGHSVTAIARNPQKVPALPTPTIRPMLAVSISLECWRLLTKATKDKRKPPTDGTN